MNKYTGDYFLSIVGCLIGMFLIIGGFVLAYWSVLLGAFSVACGAVLYARSKLFCMEIYDKEQREKEL